MPKNFLIGIGGSGARIAESALFISASGFGPQKLFLFLIDPDKGNGNLGRTTKLISKYLDCRKNYIPDTQNYVPYISDTKIKGEKINLFSTDLQVPPNEKDRVWGIFNKTKMTLSEWIGYDGLNNEKQKDEQDLMSILFSKEELTTTLDEGFRGHPSIGSVVMTELPENEYPFKLLWDELTDNTPFDVRTFLVGSVFGGTGAAGFPTLGHRNTLKLNPKAALSIDPVDEEKSISKILLGGALILPYFKVVKTDKSAGMHVTSNDFPIATKAALEFYDTKENLGFDDVYFIGDPLSQSVGNFSVGSNSQENKPHYIEVVSTLAAFDFFDQPPLLKKDPKTIYFIAKRDSERVNWSSFPYTRNEKDITSIHEDFKRKITTMTVFCYVLVTYGKSITSPENDSKNKDEFKQPWYENFNHNKSDPTLNLRTSKNKELLDKYIDFAEEYLDWIINISDYENVDLVDKTKLSEGNRKWKNPVNNSLIGEILKENSRKIGWTDVKGGGGFIQALNDDNINKNINRNAKNMLASNRLMTLFYEAAEKFAKNNYTIN
ncbi:MAG: hypothetical protein ABI863_01890 [Ginsengibacter sp.]